MSATPTLPIALGVLFLFGTVGITLAWRFLFCRNPSTLQRAVAELHEIRAQSLLAVRRGSVQLPQQQPPPLASSRRQMHYSVATPTTTTTTAPASTSELFPKPPTVDVEEPLPVYTPPYREN
ncbi:hypothetical protein BDZ88DRAFT_410715 [Geranomyces variabilis]|nr:hypothetical protein BDZ88DRAFT_410715 [Geranomyces variabilis]